MHISAPTDFSANYIRRLASLNVLPSGRYRVSEVYGCLPSSIIGSLRPSSTLPSIDIEGLRKHVQDVHSLGLQFNYTLNSPWLDSIEATYDGRKAIAQHIQTIVRCGVDRFTVALPFMARMIRSQAPNVSVSASIVAGINSVHMLRQWVDYGIDRFVVQREVNRDFQLLRALSSLGSARLEVLATTPCLMGCPDTVYHGLVSCALSRSVATSEWTGDASRYARFYCHRYLYEHPREFLKIPWIRPEDLVLYETAGASFVKIDGRDKPAEYNIERLAAYALGSYYGNLLRLLLADYPRSPEAAIDDGRDVGTGVYPAFIDNRSLDGFVDSVWGAGRCSAQCERCRLCDEMIQKVLVVDRRWVARLLKTIEGEQSSFLRPL